MAARPAHCRSPPRGGLEANMRILFLALQLPAPADNGLRQRTAAMLTALRAAGHEIVLLAAAGDHGLREAARQQLRSWCRDWEVMTLPAARLSGGNLRKRWIAWRTGQAYAACRFQSPALRARIQAWLDQENFDAVWCETPYMTASLPERIPPLIINSHNIEHKILERYLTIEPRVWRRVYARHELRRLRRWEGQALARARLIFACSELECQQIRLWLSPSARPPRVAYAPNIVAPWPAAIPFPAPATGPARLLFVGGLNWLPNRDAVEWFARQVWPRVHAVRPESEWWVVGQPGPARWQRRWRSTPGLRFLGRADNVRDCMAQAAVVLAPLRVGAGTRLKILEAASLGRTVVATTIGAEGLHFTPGREIEIADDAGAMAEAILACLRSPVMALRMGQAARNRAQAEYSPARLARQVADELAGWPRKERHGAVLPVSCLHAARTQPIAGHPSGSGNHDEISGPGLSSVGAGQGAAG